MEHNYKVVNFCKAPSGLWIGWIVKDNAHYWGSGRTMELMFIHTKNSLYTAKHCSTAGYAIATKPSFIKDVPVEYMSKNFKTRAWLGGRDKAEKIAQEAVDAAAAEPTVDNTEYDYYDSKFEGDELVVYGVIKREVARYKRDPNRKPYNGDKSFFVPLPTATTNGD